LEVSLAAAFWGIRHATELSQHTVNDFTIAGLDKFQWLELPHELFSWDKPYDLARIFLMIAGGFMIGFGTRYARGCTSGHGIFGLSSLQWTSLVAIISFFIGRHRVLVILYCLPFWLYEKFEIFIVGDSVWRWRLTKGEAISWFSHAGDVSFSKFPHVWGFL
jgi:uncharacterized membrane protein YedE/YeeE